MSSRHLEALEKERRTSDYFSTVGERNTNVRTVIEEKLREFHEHFIARPDVRHAQHYPEDTYTGGE